MVRRRRHIRDPASANRSAVSAALFVSLSETRLLDFALYAAEAALIAALVITPSHGRSRLPVCDRNSSVRSLALCHCPLGCLSRYANAAHPSVAAPAPTPTQGLISAAVSKTSLALRLVFCQYVTSLRLYAQTATPTAVPIAPASQNSSFPRSMTCALVLSRVFSVFVVTFHPLQDACSQIAK